MNANPGPKEFIKSGVIIPKEVAVRINKPFEATYSTMIVEYGKTIDELVKFSIPDPIFYQYAHVAIGEKRVCREFWHHRPKPGVNLTISIVPQGGGGVFRTIALIAVAALAITAVLTVPYLLPGLGVIGGGLLGGLAGAAISVGGTLLVNTLIPAPVQALSKNSAAQSPTYAISGGKNTANIWGKVPFVLGSFKVAPPYAALPFKEVVGSDIYWRVIFCLGHGPLNYYFEKIGNTDISEFQGVEKEFRRGYWSLNSKGNWSAATGAFPETASFGDMWTVSVSGNTGGVVYNAGQTITYNGILPTNDIHAWDVDQEKPFSLYPNDVNEDQLSVDVHYGSPQVRTSAVNADSLTVQLVFPKGLAHIQNNPPGKRSDGTVIVTIQQSPTGADSWTTVATQSIVGRQTTPMYWGLSWNTVSYGAQDTNKQYDVKVHMGVPDFDEDRNFGNFIWFSLITITAGTPVPTSGISMMAMRIKSSGQLQGVIDQYNLILYSICKDYDSTNKSWIWRPTNSLAALYRHALQHPMARDVPIPDSRIDLDRLEHWTGFCESKGFDAHGVIDSKQSTLDVINTIARIGRATHTLRDLKYSVLIDEPKIDPVQMFTPRNFWNYSGELSHTPLPHAYRAAFVNESLDYISDEVIVYDDGYDAGNSTRYERIEWIGITNRDRVWKEGRYHIAQLRLRRETHQIDIDFESLWSERGDLVLLQNDAIAVGIGTARITAATVDGCSIDVPVEMSVDKIYGFRSKSVENGTIVTRLFQVNTDTSGLINNLVFPTAVSIAPNVGDLISFGEYNRDSLRCIIKEIKPGKDLTATLTLISEGAGVHTADIGFSIPAYDPMVTVPRILTAPVVISIQSDASVMIVTAARSLLPRVVFQIQPSPIQDVSTIVLMRLSGTDSEWLEAKVQDETATSVSIIGVNSGETYDFRLLRTHPNYLTSPSTLIGAYRVVGRIDPPLGLQNFTLAIAGGQAFLQWDLPVDLDVQIGGWITFRHTTDTAFPSWANAVNIGRSINGDQTSVWLPLKPGVYMARVFDADARPSVDIVYASTNQASILEFVLADSIEEDPSFTGTKTNCSIIDDKLVLTDNTQRGVYHFDAGFDFNVVSRIRLTSHVVLEGINLTDLMDSDELFDSEEDFDGTDGALVNAELWATFTDDNPAGSPTWTDPIKIDSLEINHRGVGNIICYFDNGDNLTYSVQLVELRLLAHSVSQ